MPYDIHKKDDSYKYNIRFRGGAMIPRINQMAPCRMELSYNVIETILESMYRRPLRLEMYFVDASGREWELNYNNYKKILPKPTTPKTDKTSEVKEVSSMPKPTSIQASEPVTEKAAEPDMESIPAMEDSSEVTDMSDREMETVTLPDDVTIENVTTERNDSSNRPNQYNNQYRNQNQKQNQGKHRH